MTLKVDKDEHGLWTVLRITGELDIVTSPVVRQHVHDAVAAGRRELVLDLSDVFFCDSSGVGVLIASRKLMRSCQGRLHLILPAHGAEEGRTSTASSRRSVCVGSSRCTRTSPTPSTRPRSPSPPRRAPGERRVSAV